MLEKSLADNLVQIAIKQINHAVQFKQSRINDIQKSEDQYNGKKEPALKGRFNVPLPIMGGFVDTLMAKIDDIPDIVYEKGKEGDLKLAKLVSGAWRRDSAPTRGKWARKDRMAKKLAIFSGRAIFKQFAESKPKYNSSLDVVDYIDFICEPQGGGLSLQDHLFCGQLNIFKTKSDLITGAGDGLYSSEQVNILINTVSEKDQKINNDIYNKKISRFSSLGLDPDTNSYVGQAIWPLVEYYMSHNGIRYYLLFDYKTGIWVRAEALKDIFKSELYPYFSWASHEDAFNFWSKAPADDIRPVADSMRILFNQALDNRQKQNYGQRAFDPALIPDISQLDWRPDGLVQIDTKGGTIPLDRIVYSFTTPEVKGTIEMFDYLDNFLGQKTGITPSAQGASDKNAKVGIYFGDMQQVADRLGLFNKSYKECWQEMGLQYFYGLKEHLDEPMMIKMVGINGVEWEELNHDTLSTDSDLDVVVTGSNAEAQANEIKARRRAEALTAITSNPVLLPLLNRKWTIEQTLKAGDFEDEDVRIALDTQNDGNSEILAEAAKEMEDILAGKQVKPNRGATTAHVQKHMDFAYDTELSDEQFNAIISHAESELPIVAENMARKAKMTAPAAPLGEPTAPAAPAGPIMNSEAGMMSRSNQLSSMMNEGRL